MNLFRKKSSNEQPRKKMGCLGKTLVTIFVYIVLCGIFGVWIAGSFSTPSTKLETNTIYRLDLEGVLVEQAPEDNPFNQMLAGMPGYQTQVTVGLDDILSNIQLAKENSNILGIYLRGGNMAMGQASAKAIRDALLDFKTCGKWIVSYSDYYSANNYYVASVADEMYFNPTGTLEWNGLCISKEYYTRLLEKIGVEMQVVKVGTFKSAVEPFFRTSMSEEDRLQTERFVYGMWNEICGAVSQSRNVTMEKLNGYADEYMSLQPQEKLVEYGLIDSLIYAQQIDSIFNRIASTSDWKIQNTNAMSLVPRTQDTSTNKIAILYAEGEITDEMSDGIVGSQMVKTIKMVGEDKDVKAVVFRVNSPGGSANASEQIWFALQQLQEKGLPIVVSMGDYAASGGYYISCGADYIFAEPTSLTGSIGIFGLVPNVRKLRDKIGLDIDYVSTNAHSSFMTDVVMNGMDGEEYALMQSMVERGYDLFTSRCAQGRQMSQDSIKNIGEGRVWLGTDALNFGLVDSLGSIGDAIAKASVLGNVESYTLVYYPEKKDFLTQMMESFDSTSNEEKLVTRIHNLVSKPRIMAMMPMVKVN